MLWAGILNFKFKIVFWNIFFSRFGDLKKQIAHSEKKPPLEREILVIFGWHFGRNDDLKNSF